MKLSEAIRLGAMLRPQVYGHFLGPVPVPVYGDAIGLRAVMGSCALRAAREAGWRAGEQPMPMTECPVCHFRSEADFLVVHLNDAHRWTREQIADCVATIESPESPVPDPVPSGETEAAR